MNYPKGKVPNGIEPLINLFIMNKEFNLYDLPNMVGMVLSKYQELISKVDEINRKLEGENNKPVLTRKEVAELFSVHINTIPNWVEQGLIKEYYQGTKPYYRRDEVLAFIYEQNKAC